MKPEHNLIFNKILEAFPQIDMMLAQHLANFLPAFEDLVLSTPATARSLQTMLKTTTYPLEVNRLPRTEFWRVIFEAAAIRLISMLPEFQSNIWKDINILHTYYGHYEEFHNINLLEAQRLLEYRNLTFAALQIMPPKLEHLLDLVSKTIEGFSAIYRNGSGRTKATSRRIIIFRQESGKQRRPRVEQPNRIILGKEPDDNVDSNHEYIVNEEKTHHEKKLSNSEVDNFNNISKLESETKTIDKNQKSLISPTSTTNIPNNGTTTLNSLGGIFDYSNFYAQNVWPNSNNLKFLNNDKESTVSKNILKTSSQELKTLKNIESNVELTDQTISQNHSKSPEFVKSNEFAYPELNNHKDENIKSPLAIRKQKTSVVESPTPKQSSIESQFETQIQPTLSFNPLAIHQQQQQFMAQYQQLYQQQYIAQYLQQQAYQQMYVTNYSNLQRLEASKLPSINQSSHEQKNNETLSDDEGSGSNKKHKIEHSDSTNKRSKSEIHQQRIMSILQTEYMQNCMYANPMQNQFVSGYPIMNNSIIPNVNNNGFPNTFTSMNNEILQPINGIENSNNMIINDIIKKSKLKLRNKTIKKVLKSKSVNKDNSSAVEALLALTNVADEIK